MRQNTGVPLQRKQFAAEVEREVLSESSEGMEKKRKGETKKEHVRCCGFEEGMFPSIERLSLSLSFSLFLSLSLSLSHSPDELRRSFREIVLKF